MNLPEFIAVLLAIGAGGFCIGRLSAAKALILLTRERDGLRESIESALVHLEVDDTVGTLRPMAMEILSDALPYRTSQGESVE